MKSRRQQRLRRRQSRRRGGGNANNAANILIARLKALGLDGASAAPAASAASAAPAAPAAPAAASAPPSRSWAAVATRPAFVPAAPSAPSAPAPAAPLMIAPPPAHHDARNIAHPPRAKPTFPEGSPEAEFVKQAKQNGKHKHLTIGNARKNPTLEPGCPTDGYLAPIVRSVEAFLTKSTMSPDEKRVERKRLFRERCTALGKPELAPICEDMTKVPGMKDSFIDILGCHDGVDPSKYEERRKRGTRCAKSRIRDLVNFRGMPKQIDTHLPPLGLAYEAARGCAMKSLTPDKFDDWDADMFNTVNQLGKVTSHDLEEKVKQKLIESWGRNPKLMYYNSNNTKSKKPTTPKCPGWNESTHACSPTSEANNLLPSPSKRH